MEQDNVIHDSVTKTSKEPMKPEIVVLLRKKKNTKEIIIINHKGTRMVKENIDTDYRQRT